ncbi:hypothetical protein [Desulfonatronum sp. SC1]|uniref:hypothetical protein n=1 Tax=Desulfonatronum sp. SC1 TaxID=2109626 RepID=UPI000D30966A|nr:hypothetical protein [Desulfonatronum sp. SC1]PTN36480.1 hypothetical protein C6366_09155 [Desulfonatronum sp. SC1]
MVKKVVLFAFVSLFVFSGAYAMNLSSSDMERFIKTTKALTPYFDDLDDDHDDDEDDMIILNVEKFKQMVLDAMSGNSEMRNIVRGNGYPSVESYAEQYAHIMRAYMASSGMGHFAELERSMASMSPEKRQAFENSPVFQMVSETKRQLASVPESHIQAITPYMTQLHEVFGHDDDDEDF